MYGGFAGIYDLLMDDVDYNAWYGFYRALIGRMRGESPIATAADLCCGTGQFALRLRRDGVRVTGVDLSGEMLACAQENARRMGLSIPFVRQDVRKLELMRPVDAVICACDGVNYLISPDDVRAFLKRAYAQLKPGGVLAFDVSTRHKLAHILGNNATAEDRGAASYIWRNRWDEVQSIVTMQLVFYKRRPDGLYERFVEVHQQRGHTESELVEWMGEAGFNGVCVFGDKTFKPPKGEETRIHVVGVRGE